MRRANLDTESREGTLYATYALHRLRFARINICGKHIRGPYDDQGAVHSLSKLGYLKTVRGKGGGIKSARAPSEITVGSVIRDVAPLGPVECFVPGFDSV